MIRFILILLMMAGPVMAVEPDEILPNATQEERARAISKNLRCLVCRNENIDSSNAGIAKDLRILVRERIVAGDNDEQVLAFVVDRYGEFVLLKPSWSASNLVLWLAGPFLLLIGGFLGFRFALGNKPAQAQDLSKEEQLRLSELLDDK